MTESSHQAPPPTRWNEATSATPSKAERALICTRAKPSQGTSAVANPGPEPEDDDPLLAFAPYLHKQPRSNAITPDRQRRFIATLAATGIVNQAARSIGKSLEALYRLKHQPGAEGFSAAWDAALERGVQRLEDCALQRAVQGTPTPIVSGGKLIGTWDKPDNNLLRFMLQHRQSGRYGVQRIEPGHPVYESIKKEVLAEAGKDRLKQECITIESINAKIDEQMTSSRVEAKYKEEGDMGQALHELGLRAEEVLAIPLSVLHPRDYRKWYEYERVGDYWRKEAMA